MRAITRKKKPYRVRIDLRMDPTFVKSLETWIKKQKIRVTRTAVVEAALRAYLGVEEA